MRQFNPGAVPIQAFYWQTLCLSAFPAPQSGTTRRSGEGSWTLLEASRRLSEGAVKQRTCRTLGQMQTCNNDVQISLRSALCTLHSALHSARLSALCSASFFACCSASSTLNALWVRHGQPHRLQNLNLINQIASKQTINKYTIQSHASKQ